MQGPLVDWQTDTPENFTFTTASTTASMGGSKSCVSAVEVSCPYLFYEKVTSFIFCVI